MKPRAMSEWIAAAASSAVWPRRSGHARVSFSPAVKNVIRSSTSRRRRATSSSADGAAVAERCRLLLGQLGELGLEREVDAAGPFSTAMQRLRRQRLEPVGQLAGNVGERLPGVDVRPAPRAAARPRRAASGRPTSPASRLARAAGDVVAVGDEQLELQVLEVAGRIGARREAVEDDEQRVDLAQVAEQRRPRAWNVLDANRDRGDLPRRDDLSERVEARVGDLGHADVRLPVLAAARRGSAP